MNYIGRIQSSTQAYLNHRPIYFLLGKIVNGQGSIKLEERETTPPTPRGPQGAGPGRRAREERSPEPRDGVVACEAPGFTRRERTPNRALSLARARFHGIRRSARTDRGTGVGRRRPSPISESTYCVPWLLSFAVSLSPARNQKLGPLRCALPHSASRAPACAFAV